uniref:cyclin-J-like isoform X2 n=1 Tax=Myxine glutinosa TaxID=7769 RepID=UPI00358FEEDA
MAPFGTAASAVVNCNHFHSLLCVHVLTVLFLSRSRCCRQTGSIAAHLRCTVFPQEGRLPPFLARSPQLCLRRCLTDWIATLGQQLHLGSITRHLAVLMLDLFMERHDVPPTQLLATALSCLVIACKFEECEEHIPRRKTLAEVLNVCLPGVSVEHLLGRDVMLQTEMQVLAGLSWALFLPTAAHFSDYFLTLALHEVSFPSHQGRDKQLHLRRYTSYFLELSLQDHRHLNFPPSLVAAACVSAARMCVRLPPTWPEPTRVIAMPIRRGKSSCWNPPSQRSLPYHVVNAQMSETSEDE